MPSPPLITITSAASAELIEKKSRFIAQALPVDSEDAARAELTAIRTAHHDARHHVYAWVIGANAQIMRSSDDGEPAGTAGRPVLETIKKAELTNVMLVVTRYFGGILLGVGGLTRAYGKAAQMALDAVGKVAKIPAVKYAVSLDYALLGKVETYLRTQQVELIDKVFAEKVCLLCAIKESIIPKVKEDLNDISNGTVRLDDLGEAVSLDQQP